MHYKIILPNRQLLVVGGGNYWFGQGVRNPVLYSPTKEGYDRGQLVAPHLNERLYHNTAILLNDGTLFLAGGNANRASFDATVDIGTFDGLDAFDNLGKQVRQPKFNPDSVDINLFFVADGKIGKGHKPAPAESWTAEIYYPPYMFIDKERGFTKIKGMTLLSSSPTDAFTFSESIKDKDYYLFHSDLEVRMELDNLPQNCSANKGSLILLKLGSSTHGWDTGQQLFEIPIKSHDQDSIDFITPESDKQQIIPAFYHLFYIDCSGKPAVALSVRFDNNVQTIRDTAKSP